MIITSTLARLMEVPHADLVKDFPDDLPKVDVVSNGKIEQAKMISNDVAYDYVHKFATGDVYDIIATLKDL